MRTQRPGWTGPLLRRLGAELLPYDSPLARQVAAGIITGFALMLTVFSTVTPLPARETTLVVGYAAPLLMVVWASALLWWKVRFVDYTMFVSALLSAAIVWGMNVATKDVSAGAQVAFCAPVVFAAFQLRKAGAVAVLLGCLIGEADLVFRFEKGARAFQDLASVGFVLCVIATVLVIVGQRQNRLLTRLEEMASVDPLTGLVTRRVLDEAAGVSTSGAALMLVDLDFFKTVNDNHGHLVGDQALRHVADVLRTHARPDDVVGRLGGDELAVLLPACDAPTAVRRAEELVAAVRSTPLPLADGNPLLLSISVGVSHTDDVVSSLESLYSSADESLYEAKRAGRGRVGRMG